MSDPKCLLILTLLSLTAISVSAQDQSALLARVADSSVTVVERREAALSLLDEMRGSDLEALLKVFARTGVLPALLRPDRATQLASLENRLLARPEFVRFLAAMFRHDEPATRQAAVLLSGESTWPWLLRQRLRAFLQEKNAEVLRSHLTVIRGRLKSDEMVAVLQKRMNTAAERAALFRLGFARAPGTRRVQAWPGGRDWAARGISSERTSMPWRSLVKNLVRIPCPVARQGVTILVSLLSSAEGDESVELLLGEKSLGAFKLNAGAEVVLEAVLDAPTDLAGRELVLKLPEALVGKVAFRGVVALEKNAGQDARNAVEVVLSPDVLLESHGVMDAAVPTGGVKITGTEGQIAVKIPAFTGQVRRVDIDHWTPGAENGVWDVTLNGRPLVRLISQGLPRAAKCFPRGIALQPGRNELIFTRISGGTLHLEAIRFLR